jgi:DNA-directed RNA polymerase subunit H (RpoH/RPB5)
MNASTIIPLLFKSRKILLDILSSRGFNVKEYVGTSINEISKLHANKQLDMLIENDAGKKILVKYHLTTKLRPNHVWEMLEDLFNYEDILTETDELIILTKDKPNDTLIKLMTNIYNTEQKYFNIFSIGHLQYNILEHEMVPPHRIINDDEKNKLYKDYNIKADNNLPEIARFDPVAMRIGLRPGQIVEITRPSRSAITSKYYRLCY